MLNVKKKCVMNYAGIVLLAFLQALCYTLFIVPNDFAPAGINGIATMVQYKFNFSIGYMSLLVNIPLCLFSYFTTDKEFAVKTLIFSCVYSLAYLVFQRIVPDNVKYDAEGVNTIFPVLIAGMSGGLVYSGCFRLNASTGGTDIVSKYISKRRPQLNFFWVTFTLNAVVAVISYFVYARVDPATGELVYSYEPVCLCLLYCFMSSFIGNVLIKGGKSAYKFFIITSHAEEIDYEIVHTLKHSATKIVGTGIYSNTEKDVIICVVNKHQIVEFQNILKRFDDTFAFVETVNETIGNFLRIK